MCPLASRPMSYRYPSSSTRYGRAPLSTRVSLRCRCRLATGEAVGSVLTIVYGCVIGTDAISLCCAVDGGAGDAAGRCPHATARAATAAMVVAADVHAHCAECRFLIPSTPFGVQLYSVCTRRRGE